MTGLFAVTIRQTVIAACRLTVGRRSMVPITARSPGSFANGPRHTPQRAAAGRSFRRSGRRSPASWVPNMERRLMRGGGRTVLQTVGDDHQTLTCIVKQSQDGQRGVVPGRSWRRWWTVPGSVCGQSP